MKTLKISDEIHRKLTATVGTLMTQTGKMQTYQDAIEAMLTHSVILPTELLAEIEKLHACIAVNALGVFRICE
jgi:hypothetical protein